jgi:uncharacterized membrane protein
MLMVTGGIIILLTVGVFFYGFNAARQNFRRMLAEELRKWEDEGIVDPLQVERIRHKYRLANLARESRSLLIKTLFTFGALLIAGGIIAFVAAHWEVVPKYVRLGLLTGVMAAADWSGFYLWRVKGNSPQLGRALILLGSLVFGAVIALAVQIFHLPPDYPAALMIWAIGTTIMAYAVSSAPHLILAALASLIWFGGNRFDHPFGLAQLVYLGLVPLVYLPYAFRYQSRGSHWITLTIWGTAAMLFLAGNHGETAKIFCATALFLAWFYWFYSALPGVRRHPDFAYDSRMVGVLLVGAVGYALSFYETAGSVLNAKWIAANLLQAVAAGIIAAASLGFWIYAMRSGEEREPDNPPNQVLSGVIIILLFILFLPPDGRVLGVILANLAVAVLSLFLFWWGRNEWDRRYFWTGLLFMILLILSRFFEYRSGLLLKSLGFIAAGVALILGGLWFERKKGADE